MPDIFAALGALVRAEARRNARPPEQRPSAPSAPADPPTPQGPAAPVPAQHPTPPARPHGETAPAASPAPSSPPPTPSSPAERRPRRGLLRRLLGLVASLVRRRRRGTAERSPASDS
ncbi:hypothetical protein [Streptomyces sp. NPDC004296]|uniref:hypothetical protein n=1 Tax=Streptomyces sp. NPDC004296 TaxID=3364697 RepID=UPI0036BC32F0